MPLVSLNPDCNGKTALDLAIEKQTPKALDFMIALLSYEPFQKVCITKMMIKSFQKLIKQQSVVIYNFFNVTVYKPVLIDEAMTIVWPDDTNEVIFASHSTLISNNFLEQVLID